MCPWLDSAVRFMFQYPEVHGRGSDMLHSGELGELAKIAEAAGFHGFSLTEHPAPTAKWLDTGGHQSLDPFIALGYVAAMTTRLRLLTYLAVLPYRNPLLLAKSAATLDSVSGGRFVLGVGTGYLKAEYRALGVDFEERNELFDEALGVLPLHWSGEPFDYEGKHFSCRGTIGLPRPVQQPIPIWIGGNSKLTLRRIAERADGWMPLMGPPAMASTVRSPVATTPAEIRPMLDYLRDQAGDRFATLDLVMPYGDHSPGAQADIERHRHRLGELAELGTTWVTVAGPGGPAPATAEYIEWFAKSFIVGS